MMNKRIKNIFFTISIFIGLLNYNNIFAAPINVSSSQNITTLCDEANVTVDYYIPNSSNWLLIYPVDNMTNIDKNLFIRSWESSVVLWENTNWAMTCWDWWRLSNVVPNIDWEYMVIWGDWCTLNKISKSDSNLPDAQIVYNVAYKRQTWLKAWTSNYYYYNYNDNTQNYLVDQTKRTWWNIEYSWNECYNIYTHWCGDWIVDSNDWEQCDPNDPSKSWWWINGCSASCSPENWGWDWGWWRAFCKDLTVLSWKWTYMQPYNRLDGYVENEEWILHANYVPDEREITESVIIDDSNKNLSYPTIWNNDPKAEDFTVTVKCLWSWKSNYAKVDCWNWIKWPKPLNSSKTAEFECEYSNSFWQNFTPKCYVWKSSSLIDKTSLSCWCKVSLEKTYCWDWVVQAPNFNWELEQCDLWSANWQAGSICDSSCKIREITIPGTGNWVITLPDWGQILLWPNKDIIIWDDINPFSTEEVLEKPYIENLSKFDLMINKLCVYQKSWNSIIWDNPICITWNLLTPWEKIEFPDYPDLKSSITNIVWSYDDNEIITTINDLQNAYFVWKLNVRVSRPSISTLWWWTSFIKQTDWIANIDKVKDNWQNKNFVWVWINKDLSSDTIKLDKDSIIDKVSKEWEDNNKDLNNNIVDSDWVVISTITDINQFEKYNWIENVYIIKDKNFEINSTTNLWNLAKTYIIENWNFIINGNINYSENIAFVVKWWNIIINNNVTKIDWVYISITKDWVGWEIKWDDVLTKNVLNINWSLYWDITNLVNKRTNIKEVDWYLNVWTIISFWSNVFRQPAPLTWKFIWEYIDSKKIAK